MRCLGCKADLENRNYVAGEQWRTGKPDIRWTCLMDELDSILRELELTYVESG